MIEVAHSEITQQGKAHKEQATVGFGGKYEESKYEKRRQETVKRE